MKRLIISLCCLAAAGGGIGSAMAQDGTPFRSLKHRIAVDLRPGFVTPDNAFFKGKNAAGKPIRQAYSAHLKYGFQFGNDTHWGRLYPHTYQGIGLAYQYLDQPSVMGSPVALYAYQGSRIARLSPSLSLDYEWNFGASFGWKKQPGLENDLHGAVGSKMNAYINLGFLLHWQMAPQWHLTAGIDLTHFSNGNTHYPNTGVNLIGARVGLIRTFGEAEGAAEKTMEHHGVNPTEWLGPRFTCDLIAYGSTRKRAIENTDSPYMIPGSFGVAGININPLYRVNRYFRTGLSVDLQYDESANVGQHFAGGDEEHPKFYEPSFRERFAAGLSARGELVMPVFSINLGIGYNVIQKGPDTRGWYQVLALKTFLSRRLFLHVGYQLSNFKDPNHLMLGMGVRL